jgi:hypothetical protein
MMIPWDLSAINDAIKETKDGEEKKSRPMTDAEFQAMQIKMRRGEDTDGPKSPESEGWGELEDEFDHWNGEYGQF